jgi:transposase
MGGDHTSKRIGAHAELILATSEQEPRLFLRELRDRLAEQGVQTSTSGLSRFFQRHGISWKKGRRTQVGARDLGARTLPGFTKAAIDQRA